MTAFILIFGCLIVLELLYFRIADKLNIIDKPNQRSSHSSITLRGGGIIYPLSMLLFFFLFGFQYPYFFAGLAAISMISMADDIKHVNSGVRILVHILAVALMLLQIGLFSEPWYYSLAAFILVIGVVNAYNFMDGINGITAFYSFTVLGSLWFLNQSILLFDNNLMITLALANMVFTFFNARVHAKCFAGDVGSVSMAFSLLFLTVWAMYITGNPILILFFAIYGIDTVLTILQRLIHKENIFEAHRKHLFQYLANELKWTHVSVSLLYTVLQILVSVGVLLVWQLGAMVQWIFAVGVLGLLGVIYLYVKHKIYRQYVKTAPSVSL